MNTRRYGRDIHGVLLLDKPSGISSNRALQTIKRIYRANKAGHTGTLDPLATGLLPICLGKATKSSQYLLNSKKRYRVTAKLGQKTDTGDSCGRVIKDRKVIGVTLDKVDRILNNFKGDFLHKLPIYSAIRFQGKRLYEYARQGIVVPLKYRKITVYEISLIKQLNNELELEVYCSKGTYIRTIIDDIGEELGCGAHVLYLRRISVGQYTIKQSFTIQQLYAMICDCKKQNDIILTDMLDALLIPVDNITLSYNDMIKP